MSGDEDRATSGRRRRALSAALQSTKDVVADLTDLTFADASVMLDLAVLARRLRLHGKTLRVRGQKPSIHALIELVGLDRLPAVAIEPPPHAVAAPTQG